MTTLDQALIDASDALAKAGLDQPRIEARTLLSHVLKMSSAQILSRGDTEIEVAALSAYRDAVSSRCAGMPLAYITGTREFWSLPLQVSPATLIPRPDTETVVELVLEHYRNRRQPDTILDLGTGSGCLLLALLTEFPDAHGTGIDLSADACSMASANAALLGLAGRSTWVTGSWTETISRTYDLIVSNPPYIPTHGIGMLQIDVRDYEPINALDGGVDGLDAYRSLFPLAENALAPEGLLAVEIGIDQGIAVSGIATESGLVSGPARVDLSGIERALSFYKKGVGINEATR